MGADANELDTREEDRERYLGIYYNTNGEDGEELMSSRERCAKQEGVVLSLYRRFRFLSPSECHREHHNMFGEAPPLTSIRRAITNLAHYGLLEKTSMRRTGIYGKKEYIWKYRQPDVRIAQAELF
jgi:hypothetical protein